MSWVLLFIKTVDLCNFKMYSYSRGIEFTEYDIWCDNLEYEMPLNYIM